MLGTFINAFKIPELRNRILFSLVMILVFRLGCQIPTPGIDPEAMSKLISSATNSVIGFFNIFGGGALEQFSIFALGIAPYINSSIIMQLLIYVVPDLERMAKEEGEEGRKKISQYTRYGTVFLGMLQAFGISVWLESVGRGGAGGGESVVVMEPGWSFRIMAVLTLTTGTAFLMWVGEQMTAMGIGNGVSLLISAGIVSRIPGGIAYVSEAFGLGAFNPIGYVKLIALMMVMYGVIAAVVAVQDAVRKIPVQHAKRMVGRRMYGGAATHIPLKINQGGVIPVIFASSILMFPGLIFNWLNSMFGADTGKLATFLRNVGDMFRTDHWFYWFCEFTLIVFFTYFYSAITMNPKEIADNLKKYGGFIPGIRAGRKTTEYIDRILNRITLAGGVALGCIAIVPQMLVGLLGLTQMVLGGTSLLIVVGVALDTVRQMESHMVTRHYQGFMK